MTAIEHELIEAALELATALRMQDGLDIAMVDRLRRALSAATHHWAGSDVIPKSVASLFVDLAPSIDACSYLYQGELAQDIRYLADEIAALIRGCVATPAPCWVPILYREFYDIPRCFLVERAGELLLFDCRFDAGLGDYAPDYEVSRIRDELRSKVTELSWQDLGNGADRLCSIPTGAVTFDDTRRLYIDVSVFSLLDANAARASSSAGD